jgi:hypothetical protein
MKLVSLSLVLISGTGLSLTARASRGDQPAAAPAKVAGDKQSLGPEAAKLPSATASDSNRRTPHSTPHSSRVLFIMAKDCPKCDAELARLNAPSGDFAWLRSGGWRIGPGPENHIQIVDREAIPDLVRKLAPREYPAVACIEDGEVVRSFKSGCTTPLDAWMFDWLAKGVNERPAAPVLEAARVESTGSYPLRGNHWSVEGDWNPSREKVIEHLRGPNHVAYLQASWHIDAWSYEELRSLHDDLHERYGPWDTSAGSSETAANTPAAIARKYKGG